MDVVADELDGVDTVEGEGFHEVVEKPVDTDDIAAKGRRDYGGAAG